MVRVLKETEGHGPRTKGENNCFFLERFPCFSREQIGH